MESQLRHWRSPEELVANEHNLFRENEPLNLRVGKRRFTDEIHRIRQPDLLQGIAFAEAEVIHNEQFAVRAKFYFRKVRAFPERKRAQYLARIRHNDLFQQIIAHKGKVPDIADAVWNHEAGIGARLWIQQQNVPPIQHAVHAGQLVLRQPERKLRAAVVKLRKQVRHFRRFRLCGQGGHQQEKRGEQGNQLFHMGESPPNRCVRGICAVPRLFVAPDAQHLQVFRINGNVPAAECHVTVLVEACIIHKPHIRF